MSGSTDLTSRSCRSSPGEHIASRTRTRHSTVYLSAHIPVTLIVMCCD
jgi:hypothetical protein